MAINEYHRWLVTLVFGSTKNLDIKNKKIVNIFYTGRLIGVSAHSIVRSKSTMQQIDPLDYFISFYYFITLLPDIFTRNDADTVKKIQFNSIQFNSIQFNSSQVNSIHVNSNRYVSAQASPRRRKKCLKAGLVIYDERGNVPLNVPRGWGCLLLHFKTWFGTQNMISLSVSKLIYFTR